MLYISSHMSEMFKRIKPKQFSKSLDNNRSTRIVKLWHVSKTLLKYTLLYLLLALARQMTFAPGWVPVMLRYWVVPAGFRSEQRDMFVYWCNIDIGSRIPRLCWPFKGRKCVNYLPHALAHTHTHADTYGTGPESMRRVLTVGDCVGQTVLGAGYGRVGVHWMSDRQCLMGGDAISLSSLISEKWITIDKYR